MKVEHSKTAEQLQLEKLKNNPKSIHLKDDWGNTPLHKAAETGMLKVTKFLLEHGADVNARNNRNETPLHTAYISDSYQRELEEEFQSSEFITNQDRLKSYKLLIKHGADIDAQDKYGCTILHYSAGSDGDVATCKWIVKQGGNVNIKNLDEKTALDIASEYGSVETFNFLMKSKIKIDIKNDLDKTLPQTPQIESTQIRSAKVSM